MSSIQKSAKTTERRVKIAKHTEYSTPTSDKTRNVPSRGRKREVGTSADALADGSTTKLGDTSLNSAREQDSSLPSSFKIIAGSYERLLYGLQGSVSLSSPASTDLEWTLKPIFIFPAHVSYIKSVAASPQGGKWLVTGSQDEIIKVWDLRRRREVGGLMQHEGSPFSLVLRSNWALNGQLCRLHH